MPLFSRRGAFRRGRARAERLGDARRGMPRAAGPRPRSRGPGETSAGLPGVSRGRPPARCRFERRRRTPAPRAFSHSILASRSVTGPSAIAGRYFHRDFFCFTAFLFRSVPGFRGPLFFSRHAERAKRPKNLTSRRRSLVLLSSRRRRNRACAWTARLSRAFPATSAGAAKCAIASRRIDETCARA